MATDRVNYNPSLTKRLVTDGMFRTEPVTVIDVGASGGIEQHWRIFGEQLVAVGFEPLVKECTRLNKTEHSQSVRYHPFFVGSENYQSLFSNETAMDPVLGWSNQPFPRTSSVRAQQAMNMSFTKRFNNDDDEIVLTEQATSLDGFFSTHPIETIDFIKIDTDGHDYEVLCGARETLGKYPVLGLFVECQFHGVVHPHANLFSNIDKLLRDEGFSLFDIEVHRYTRACLPGRFVYDIPAQTTSGQVLWGDALYLRDVAAKGYADRWRVRFSAQKLLKLACLFEIYGLPDCAAELLLEHQGMLGGVIDVGRCLDMLTAEIDPSSASYAEYNRKFDAAPESFFPSRSEEAMRSAVRIVVAGGMRGLLGRMRHRFAEALRGLGR